MRQLLASVAFVAAAAVASSVAQAADMPVRKAAPVAVMAPAFSWTGFYVGGHAGYGWGRATWTPTPGLVQDPNNRHDIDGALAGGQIGFNFQTGSWVLGAEADISWADISGSGIFDPGLGRDPAQTQIRWMSLVTGRVGYAFGQWLPYFKGGVAFANQRYSIGFPLAPGAPTTVTTDTRTGWTIGGGLEYAFTPNWSIRGEYTYVDLGDGTARTPFPGFTINVDSYVHVAKFAVNYRFGGR